MKIEQYYTFSLDYWFRYFANGEQEKDFENVEIIARTYQEAKAIVIEKFNRRSARIFSVELVSQIPTITKNQLFFLTNPKNITI
jgi:hypothetical protein